MVEGAVVLGAVVGARVTAVVGATVAISGGASVTTSLVHTTVPLYFKVDTEAPPYLTSLTATPPYVNIGHPSPLRSKVPVEGFQLLTVTAPWLLKVTLPEACIA